MKMQGRVLVGSVREFKTRKGETLPKASLKVVDMGIECSSDVTIYWVDFLGDAALTQMELDSVVGGEFTLDVKFVRASAGKEGKAYLNMAGGAITNAAGQVVQLGLRTSDRKAS